ncbi:MAG: protease modulator HflC [Beijerinckiaceae bacterium]
MSSPFRFIGGIVLTVVGLLVLNAAFIVQQTSSALVFQFGRVSRAPITAPGLYFKMPFIETVVFIDNRVLDNDLSPQEVLASDQKNLVVDAFTRYRITDPLRFYQSLNNTRAANIQLERIINARMRSVLAGASTSQIIDKDRARLMDRIQDEVNRETQSLGITVVDVRLSRVELPRETSQAVFQRMKTDREREAAELRAQGAQAAQTVRARADRDVQIIMGEANKKSEEFRGEGDANKNRIFAEAFGRDPDFFRFYRSMQAYETGLKQGDTRLILSPNSDFFRYFNDPSGKKTVN